MSGVIVDGKQYEHCNKCGRWVAIQNLCYQKPAGNFPYGMDLCHECASQTVRRIMWYFQGPRLPSFTGTVIMPIDGVVAEIEELT